jgi:hypothetical protein
MTKQSLMTSARQQNPRPQYRIENDVQIELTEEEYEASLTALVEMQLQQQKASETSDAHNAAIASARAKLSALGLNENEIAAIIGA